MLSYKIAVKMFHREHDRWYQWGLFFMGFITSIYLIGDKYLPLWMLCYLASAASFVWVIVVQNMRASTDAWRRIIIKIENGKKIRVFDAYNRYSRHWPRYKDLKRTFCCRETLVSISRILALIGVILLVIFVILGTILGISDLYKWIYHSPIPFLHGIFPPLLIDC